MNTWSEISRAGKARRSSIFWLDRTMREERTKRPENIRPKMDVGERAKLFAPYAALGRMDTVLICYLLLECSFFNKSPK